jgi:hypothetical protein
MRRGRFSRPYRAGDAAGAVTGQARAVGADAQLLLYAGG